MALAADRTPARVEIEGKAATAETPTRRSKTYALTPHGPLATHALDQINTSPFERSRWRGGR